MLWPLQYTPPVSVWGAARAVAPREGAGVTLNLAPVEQVSEQPLIRYLGEGCRETEEAEAEKETETEA